MTFPHQGLRPLRADDAGPCTRLFETYMSRFDLTPAFNAEEFLHWFTPRNGIVNTYVVEKQGIFSFLNIYKTSFVFVRDGISFRRGL